MNTNKKKLLRMMRGDMEGWREIERSSRGVGDLNRIRGLWGGGVYGEHDCIENIILRA